MSLINSKFVINNDIMRKLATILIFAFLPIAMMSQSKSSSYGLKMMNNLYIVKGSDTLWIQQGDYAWFSATDTIYFGSVTSLPDAISVTQTAGNNTTKIATTAFVQQEITASGALPSVTGQANKLLTNNGTIADWTDTLRADFYMDWFEIHDVVIEADSVYWPNDTPILAIDGTGGYQGLFKLNTSTEIDVLAPLNIFALRALPDTYGTILDIGLTAAGNHGDKVGANIWVGGIKMVDIRVQNDGTGGVIDGSEYVYLDALYVLNEHTDQSTVTGDTEFTSVVPKGYLLKYLIAEETAGNAATLDLGTTSGGNDVFINQTFAASTITTVVINKVFSFSAAQSLFLNDDDAGSSWNSGSLNVYFVLEKIAE